MFCESRILNKRFLKRSAFKFPVWRGNREPCVDNEDKAGYYMDWPGKSSFQHKDGNY